MSVNRVILVGRLGSDPEIRETNSGVSVANFSLATDETFKNREGEKQKRTEWHRLVLWDKLAKIAQDYLHKGDLVYVEGKIQSRQFEDASGTRKTATEIVVSNLNMLSTKPKVKSEAEVEEDDIPF
jgi:single-strand DNA-binding protein